MADAMDTAGDCKALAEAVVVLHDPSSSEVQRSAAQQVCNSFRKSPVYGTYGLQLASNTGPTAIRLFGLRALHYFITHRWHVASRNVRGGIVQLLTEFTKAVFEEDPCVKETVVSVVVARIQQDWPDYWCGLCSELSALCKKGSLPAELVMLTLLQLAEKTMTLPHARRCILDCALERDMHDVLQVITILLWDSFAQYQHRKAQPLVSPTQECYSVIRTTLTTLAGYLNWVDVSHITEENFQLLDLLWCLLKDPELQLEVAECLLIAINRVGIRPGSQPLLVLFAHVARPYIFPVLQKTVGKVLTERLYYFLKKMCQLACIFGQQLCDVLGLNGCVTPPSDLMNYLAYLLDFTKHCSQRLSCMTQDTWKRLFSHKLLSCDPRLLAMLPKYLLATRTNLMKVGFPSESNSPPCKYSRIEFATDEDFCKFLIVFRDEQKQVIDAACQLNLRTCFRMAVDWLRHLLLSSDSKPPISPSSDGLWNSSTESSLQWEAMTFYLKIIAPNLLQNLKKHTLPLNNGIELLQLLLNFKTKDPLVLSCLPATISTLVPFLRLNSESFPKVLTKLLDIIQDIKTPKALPLISARKDALFCVHQLCKENAEFPLPSFAILFSHVKQLLCDELLQLTQLEKSLLMEAMVVLINQFKDYEQQKAYLEELMAPVSSLWLSEEMQRIFANPKAFVSYVGADLQVIDTVGESPTDLNRSGIIHCIATIIGVLRWTRSPTDHEQAKSGGFIGAVSNGKLMCRNPCTEQVLKLLDNVLLLIMTQHNLYLPEVSSDMCDLFPLVLDWVNVRNTSTLDIPQPFLDIYDPPEYKTALERMQGFFSALYSCCFYILGCAASALKDAFYVNNLVNRVCNTAFKNLEYVPDYRQLSVVRFFLKPLASSCPPEYYHDFVCPIMRSYLPSLNAKLSNEWNVIGQGNVANKKKTEVNNIESQETQQKRLKLLTEEVMEFVIDCCVLNEGLKTFVAADVAGGTNSHEESLSITYVSSQDGNAFVADADLYSKVDVDADTAVYTAESDDDDCPCTADGCNSTVLAGNYVECSVLNEKAKASVVLEESDSAHHLPCESHNFVVGFDNACSLAIEGADPEVVSDKANAVHSLFIKNEDASVFSSESDGEIAAEVPQPVQPVSKHDIFSEQPQLKQLGVCLMQDEDVRSNLLAVAFSSLVCKDCCYRVATLLCWPLLQHVILEPLPADTVTYLYTMTLKGLRLHRHDPLVSDAIDRLAFHIYLSLRPCYTELNTVMRHIPNINFSDLETFDAQLLDPKNRMAHDQLQQCFKDLFKRNSRKLFSEKVPKVDCTHNLSQSPLKTPFKLQGPRRLRQLFIDPMNCPPPFKKLKK